jgi:ribosome recycling factor
LQQIQISPFDASNLKAISEAIRSDQNLGLTPTDDGRVVRITIPPLTEETRQSMVKILHQKEEDSFISARQIRHEALRQAEQAEKNNMIGKDEFNRVEKQIDDAMGQQRLEIEKLTKNKEQEILKI